MISKVRLKNWRSHEDSELHFSGGTNALLGIIGSGKSSVLDAICFCLFGTFPTLQARKLKLDDILTSKPVGKSRAEVEVQFSEDGKNYSVKRVIESGRGTTYSEIKENGKVIESPNTSRVNELVEKILKVNYDLFSKAIYSEQNSLDYFLTIPRGQRMRKIDELLMIDRFEKARAGAVSVVKKLLDRREARQSAIESAGLDESEKLVNNLKGSIESMRKEGAELAGKMEQLAAQRKNVEKEIREVRKVKDALEEMKREEKGIASVVEDTYRSMEEMEKSLKGSDIDASEKRLREVARNLADLEKAFAEEQRNYTKLQNQATKARTEVELVKRDRLDRLEKELEEKIKAEKELKSKKMTPDKIEKKQDEKKKAVEKFVAEMEVARMRVNDAKETIDHLNKIHDKCPLCDSKITEEKKATLINKKKFEIEKLKRRYAKAAESKDINEKELKELEEMAGKLEEMIESVKGIDKLRSEMNNTKNVYSVLEEQARSFEKDLSSVKDEVAKIEKRMLEARGKKDELESEVTMAREYANRKSKIESLLSSRKKLESKIRELEKSVEGKGDEQLEKLWKDLVTEEKEIAGKLASMSEISKEKRARVGELEAKLGGARREIDEVKKLDSLIEQMKVFEKALEATQAQLRREFVASVNYTMNELWPNLYPYRDFTGIQLSIEEGDYVLQLQEAPGRWVNVEGFASGGERSIAALTLRMAFALVLAPQLKWLVLDEPTANMDVKAVEDLATTLGEHIGNFIDQTFLITHDEKLEKAVTGYAYKLERDKANSGATKVVQI